MPIYEYGCVICGRTMEKLKKFSQCDEVEECFKCKKPMKKTITLTKIILADGYWARNNYQNQGKLELDEALKENDVHRKTHDKLIKKEEKAGLLDSPEG